MRPMLREPFNPFDTSEKICFPDLDEGLALGVGQDSSEDIDRLSRLHPVEIDSECPPDLGYLPLQTSQLLQAQCQQWFTALAEEKALRVRVCLCIACSNRSHGLALASVHCSAVSKDISVQRQYVSWIMGCLCLSDARSTQCMYACICAGAAVVCRAG